MKRSKKIFIFAFDGLPLILARKLAKEGVMPNLARLLKKGKCGNLESSLPPLTATAWVSFVTGKDPGSHGIFNFLQPKDDLNNLEVISTLNIKGKTFYEILEEKGKKCILINLPCSYPSRIKKGILISSFLAGEDFFYPQDLIEEIPELAKYKIAPDFVIGLDIERRLDEIFDVGEKRFVCGQKLFQRDWDCFFYLVSGTDWTMHLVFEKLLRGKKINPQAKKIFKRVDFYLGWFLANLPKDTAVLVMSDHGFSALSKVFYINTWLRKQNLLNFRVSWRKKGPQSLTEAQIIRSNPKNLRGKMFRRIALCLINNPAFYSLLSWVIRVMSFFFFDYIPEYFLELGSEINLSRTKAYALPGGGGWFGLFINDKKRFKHGTVSQKEYSKLRQRIYNQLVQTLGKESVWLKEEVYHDKAIGKCPDILYCSKEIFVSPAFSRKIFAKRKLNHHSLSGFFLIVNKKTKRGKEIKGLKITDLAPTILYYMGIRLSSEMKGRILKSFI